MADKTLEELTRDAKDVAEHHRVSLKKLPEALKENHGPGTSDMYANVAGHNKYSASNTYN